MAVTTLVLEGGGLRGAFGAGVLAELSRQHAAEFRDIVTVSSGAPTAAYCATGQIEDGVEIWRTYTHGAQLISPRNLLAGRPLMDVDRLVGVFERTVRLDVDKLATSSTRLWICVTDARTGRPRRVRATAANVFALLRATMALPVANGRIIEVDGEPAIDGGVTAAVPLADALELAGDRIVVVLTRPRGYRRSPNALADLLVRWTYPRYPAIRRALAHYARGANATLDRIDALEASGAISVIRPREPVAAHRLSRARAHIEATIASGIRAASEWLARAA